MMHKPFLRIAAVVAACLVPAAASASGLRISPVRLDLSAAQPSSQVDLFNATNQPVPVQVTAYRWTQEQGEDKYEKTKDIFFAPPIVTVPPEGRASVRLRLRNPQTGTAEASYRLYFQELPSPKSASTPAAAMTFRVRFGVPLFVQPKTAVAPALKVTLAPQPGRLAVVLENTGKAHLKIEGMEAFPADVDRKQPGAAPTARARQSVRGTSYLLPGSRHEWQLDLPPAVDPQSLVLLVRTDDRSNRAGSGLDQRGWLWRPVAARPDTPAPASP